MGRYYWGNIERCNFTNHWKNRYAGGTGYVIEYAGNLISDLSVEQRMTICNMTIEGGARAGLIQPDEKIFKYLKGNQCHQREKTGIKP